MKIDDVIGWLATTGLHGWMQTTTWAVPAVQTVHILAICTIIGASLMLNLRMVGFVGMDTPLVAFGNRYLPYLLPTLAVLLLTGAVLVTAEPDRDLLNWVFWTKMGLVVVATLATIITQFLFHKDWDKWQQPARGMIVRSLGALLLITWVAIIFCGRWIAYT